MEAVPARGAGARVAGWLFAGLLIATGAANLWLVDPVPAAAYALVSLVYLPPAGAWLRRRFGFRLHPLLAMLLAVAIVLFTLGVSDLGDLLD